MLSLPNVKMYRPLNSGYPCQLAITTILILRQTQESRHAFDYTALMDFCSHEDEEFVSLTAGCNVSYHNYNTWVYGVSTLMHIDCLFNSLLMRTPKLYAVLSFGKEILQWTVDSTHKGPAMQKTSRRHDLKGWAQVCFLFNGIVRKILKMPLLRRWIMCHTNYNRCECTWYRTSFCPS